MYVHHDEYKPKFVKKASKGRYANNLFMGFESEMGCIEWQDYIDQINSQYGNILYAKEDVSISFNMIRDTFELNSHPFNWNWMMKNHTILDKIEEMSRLKDYLKATKAKVNRSCGFHIHLSKKYYTRNHLFNMAKFFYTNTNFIRKISLRGNTRNFAEFSSLSLKKKERDDLFSKRHLPMENKYLALNFSNMNTVEIRIFQGTLKKDTVLSYLQFALAVTMFTKKFKWDHMTENNFVKYVYKHKKSYSKLIDLIEGKITWK